MTMTEAPPKLAGTVEYVRADELAKGDTIIVDGHQGEYIDRIWGIDEYAVVFAHSPHGVVPFRHAEIEANGRCLCIRLPHLNTYRARHDNVRRVVMSARDDSPLHRALEMLNGGPSALDEIDQLRADLLVANNRLGNAVGALVDAGTWCTGPEDVTAGIGRLAAAYRTRAIPVLMRSHPAGTI